MRHKTTLPSPKNRAVCGAGVDFKTPSTSSAGRIRHKPMPRITAPKAPRYGMRKRASESAWRDTKGWVSFIKQRGPATVDYIRRWGRFMGMFDTDGTGKFLVDLPSIQPHDPLSLHWRLSPDGTSIAVVIIFHPLPRLFCSVERLIKCTGWHAMIAT